ncbi:MAG: type IV toxin-antitoxin system AbiEi family antitoxin domain-containing protein [Thermoleophilaceae bacterium]|nr:type IV toxin-antitoxin system AbiEi family antitoxin domain-containing protein [Thermoleophilaceae bacterium]
MHANTKPNLRALEAQAYDQYGYFDTSQAREHGVSSQLLAHHVGRGRFERIRRGLYKISGFPTDEYDQMRKLWMAVGRKTAVLSHQSALSVYELSDQIPDAVHLLVARRQRGLRRPEGSVIHTRPDGQPITVVWRSGLPLTTVARTLVDVHGLLQPEQWSMTVHQAVSRGLVTIAQLHSEPAKGKRRIDAELRGMQALR